MPPVILAAKTGSIGTKRVRMLAQQIGADRLILLVEGLLEGDERTFDIDDDATPPKWITIWAECFSSSDRAEERIEFSRPAASKSVMFAPLASGLGRDAQSQALVYVGLLIPWVSLLTASRSDL